MNDDNLLRYVRFTFSCLLAELRALGFRPYLTGEPGAEILKIKGPRDPITGELRLLPRRLAIQLREEKDRIIGKLRTEHWLDRLEALYDKHVEQHSPETAEALALAELRWEWHIKYRERVYIACAECRKASGRLYPVGDGNAVHEGCAAAYAIRWQAEADAALAELGVIDAIAE